VRSGKPATAERRPSVFERHNGQSVLVDRRRLPGSAFRPPSFKVLCANGAQHGCGEQSEDDQHERDGAQQQEQL
jgi:hypothetical protein